MENSGMHKPLIFIHSVQQKLTFDNCIITCHLLSLMEIKSVFKILVESFAQITTFASLTDFNFIQPYLDRISMELGWSNNEHTTSAIFRTIWIRHGSNF